MNKPTSFAVGLAVACVSATLSGCVIAEQIPRPHEAVRDNIRKGELVKPGDWVVVTANQQEFVFRVTEVDDHAIHGAQVEVPIDEVVALKVVDSESARLTRMRTEVDSVGAAGAVAAMGAAAIAALGIISLLLWAYL